MPLELPSSETISKPSSPDDVNLFLKGNDTDNKEVKAPKEEKPDKAVDKDDDNIELKDDKEDDEKLDLDDDDEDKKVKKQAKPEADDDEDEDEDKEDKDSLKDDDIELDAPPKKKEITAAYPDFFKKFPFMEKMLYRDRQYTELFGSFDDAKEVAESAQALAAYEEDLMAGNNVKVLQRVKEIDTKAFDKMVDNYLPNLAKVDKEAYLEVVGSIGKRMIEEMSKTASEFGESNKEARDSLKHAALILNQFLFNSSTFVPHKPRVDAKVNPEKEEIDQERIAFVRERFEGVRNDLQTKVDRVLRSTIAEYIDPKGEMSPYVKKNAIRDAVNMLHQTIGGDTAFRKNLDKLWDNVFATRFSQDSQDKVRRTYLGKAKTHLRDVLRKARTEAMKEAKPSRTSEKDDDENEKEERPKKASNISGRPHQDKGGKLAMRKGETVAEFLARD